MIDIVTQDIAINMRNISNEILNQISDDIRYVLVTYQEYHIHDFANQHGVRNLQEYVTYISESNLNIFHIIIINNVDLKSSMFSENFTPGSVTRMKDNIILACVNAGREEDDIVCLRLFHKLTLDEEFKYISDRVIIRTDDDMTRPQHGLLSVAHRYYNSYINYVGENTNDVGLRIFYEDLSKSLLGARGRITQNLYDPNEEARRNARAIRFQHQSNDKNIPKQTGGCHYREKYTKYKHKYLELKNKN